MATIWLISESNFSSATTVYSREDGLDSFDTDLGPAGLALNSTNIGSEIGSGLVDMTDTYQFSSNVLVTELGSTDTVFGR